MQGKVLDMRAVAKCWRELFVLKGLATSKRAHENDTQHERNNIVEGCASANAGVQRKGQCRDQSRLEALTLAQVGGL